ncbi:GDYXXLXY domain-containing protein [Candidatus Woesearchaeota archaeon]|nr:GDYXXLXY domain-containing protein [Candidatus Woesearchaeota archaeon]
MAKKDGKKSQKRIDKNIIRLLLGLSFLLLIIISFILFLSWPLLTGTTVELATRPVDPFDILRGQYMTIGYEISTIPGSFNQGDIVYVSLEPDNEGIWRLTDASTQKPDKGVFIKGTMDGNNRVRYGIEQFFFERNADVPTRDITVEVKIDSQGNARIVQLLQNREPVEIEYEAKSLTS